MPPFAKILITMGVVLIVAGLLWALFSRLGFGRLPGDILIEGKNSRVYIPFTSAILLSVVLTLVLNVIVWIISRM